MTAGAPVPDTPVVSVAGTIARMEAIDTPAASTALAGRMLFVAV